MILPDRVFSTESVEILYTDISRSVIIDGIIFPIHSFICGFKMLIISLFSLLGLYFR